tara:strand:- start:63 stop:791 length:729 start_codon:yes stop_codon:yes gene_type:complete
MAEASGGSGVSKAVFFAETSGGETTSFTVQYNPKDFKYDKSVTWKPHEVQGKLGPLEFQKSSPATMSMELMFDTTHDGSDVRKVWVNRLLCLTNADVKAVGGEAGKTEKERPPQVTFAWGDFQMFGVIESLNVSYLMFSSTGTPLRAKVQVKMKEWEPENHARGTDGPRAGYGSAPTKLVTVQAGETATSLAAKHGVPVRKLAADNGWDDLLEDVKAGAKVIIKREAKKALPGVPDSVWKKL